MECGYLEFNRDTFFLSPFYEKQNAIRVYVPSLAFSPHFPSSKRASSFPAWGAGPGRAGQHRRRRETLPLPSSSPPRCSLKALKDGVFRLVAGGPPGELRGPTLGSTRQAHGGPSSGSGCSQAPGVRLKHPVMCVAQGRRGAWPKVPQSRLLQRGAGTMGIWG